MRTRVSLAALIIVYFTALASADDNCFERTGQFSVLRHCVTSALTGFGPESLAATGEGAWCATADRNQIVTLYLKPPAPLRTVTLTNGYAKSNDTFRQYGRVKRAVIETNTGYQGFIEPKDTTASQSFIIAKGTYAWIRLRILETARGNTNATPCLSEFLVNLEEFGNN